MMGTILIAYAVMAVTFLPMDFACRATMVNNLYRPPMGDLLLRKSNLGVGAGLVA